MEDLAASFDDAFRRELDTEPLVGNILAVVGDKYVLNLECSPQREAWRQVCRQPSGASRRLDKPVEVPVGTLRAISVEEEAFPNGAIDLMHPPLRWAGFLPRITYHRYPEFTTRRS